MNVVQVGVEGLIWATRASARALGCPRMVTADWGHAWIQRQLEDLDLSDAVLVDIGSGESHPLMVWYLQHVREAILVDLTNLAVPHERARVLQHDLEKPLPLHDDSVDVIVSASVLEHLSHEARVLQMREFERVLKPGGRVVFTVSYLYPLDETGVEILSRDPWLNEHGNQITSILDMRAMLESAPGLQLACDADKTKFPGYGQTPAGMGEIDDLLTMDLRDNEWATFAPATNALGIRWAEVGVHLVKGHDDDGRDCEQPISVIDQPQLPMTPEEHGIDTTNRRVLHVREDDLSSGERSVSLVPDSPWTMDVEERYDVVIAWHVFGGASPYAVLAWLSRLAPVMLFNLPIDRTGEECDDLHGSQPTEAWLRMAADELDLQVESYTRHGDQAVALVTRQRDQLSPLIVHFHIPKTAGQSFNEYLAGNVGANMAYFYPPIPSKGRWDQIKHAANHPVEQSLKERIRSAGRRLLGRSATDGEIPAVLAAHACRILLPGTLGGRLPLYVGFVREPYKQILSYIKYIKRNYHDLSEGHRGQLPRQAPEMSIEELVHWHVKNVQWSMFGGLVTPVFFMVDRPDLERAKHLARRFLMLGVVEQMDRSVELLKRKLAPYGFELTGEMPHRNTTSDMDLDGYDIRNDAVFRDYAGRLLDVELEFYRWAVDRFNREADRAGL